MEVERKWKGALAGHKHATLVRKRQMLQVPSFTLHQPLDSFHLLEVKKISKKTRQKNDAHAIRTRNLWCRKPTRYHCAKASA